MLLVGIEASSGGKEFRGQRQRAWDALTASEGRS